MTAFPGRAVGAAIVGTILLSRLASAQTAELVTVQKVIDDKAILVRANGLAFLIEKGVGCISLPRYEGKKVAISSPGIFLGVGSRLLITDLNQECRIWSSTPFDSPRRLPDTADRHISGNVTSTDNCYASSITSPKPFMGKNGEIFRLADGSIWEVKYEYEYLYEYSPSVVICPARGKLAVAGKTLNVQKVSSADPSPVAAPQAPSAAVIESRIDGEFTGWDGETIFKLPNGQIWQQSAFAYKYKYAYGPKVLIYKSGSTYKMRVDGVDGEISVTRIK